MTRFNFVRHGQTDWNAGHRIMGSADIELNDVGKAQAIEMRDKLKGKQIDVIIVSPLLRAQETARIIAEFHREASLIVADELSERNFGDYEGKPNGGDYYGLWEYDNDNTPNGETPKDLEARIYPFLDRLRDSFDGKEVLLVAHGGIGTIIWSYFEGIPSDGDLLKYVVGNGELKVFDTGPRGDDE